MATSMYLLAALLVSGAATQDTSSDIFDGKNWRRHQGQWKTLAHIAVLTVAGPAHGQVLAWGNQCECFMAVGEGHGTEFRIHWYFSNPEIFFFKVLFSLQMSGMFENWLYKLVSALQTREKGANVVVVDWLPLAHQLYVDAVNNTRGVGHSIAQMLDWLQVTVGLKGIISFSEKDLESEPF